MEYRDFGNTGLKVSVLGYGGAAIWGEKSISTATADKSDEEIGRVLNAVLDAGVTLIDTAGMYGQSERRIGRHIAARRDEFVLSSKCGYDNEVNEDWSAAAITAGIDRSLSDLRTDRIDIMHLHSCGLDVLKEGEAIGALEKAVKAGKVRIPAYSGDNEELAWAIESGRFESVQTSLNICDQRVLDGLLPRTKEKGLGVIVKRPLANAFWRFQEQPKGDYAEEYWRRARAMNLAPPPGIGWDEFAMRFAAFQPGVSSCIVGTKNLNHLRSNLEALAKGPLPPDVIARTQDLFRHNDRGWEGQT